MTSYDDDDVDEQDDKGDRDVVKSRGQRRQRQQQQKRWRKWSDAFRDRFRSGSVGINYVIDDSTKRIHRYFW